MKRLILSVVAIFLFPLESLGEKANSTNDPAQGNAISTYEKCVVVTSWLHKGKDAANLDNIRQVVKIPPGWEVVDTSVINDEPVFYLCKLSR